MSKIVCPGCRDGAAFPLPFTMAFQPIVDVRDGAVFAHEALVRGPAQESAFHILSQVDDGNRYAFDQQCRVRAIELAAKLGLPDGGARLSINFLPNAVYEPKACIRLTLQTADRTGFPPDRLIFEFTESEEVETDHVGRILTAYKAMGFSTAIDDFGAGHSGLNLLARFQPDIIKLDMQLIRDLGTDRVKRAIVTGMARICEELGILVVAEGIETLDEHWALRDIGVHLQQGYLIARPMFEGLATPSIPTAATAMCLARTG